MNILVVDDEKNIAYAIAQIFEEQKWQVTMAYDGQEGLDLALSGYYDVAVLDIMLPDEDGLEILRKLRKNPETRKVPIIMVTAKTTEIDKVKGLDSGADDYLTKPFGVMELISRVKALLRRSMNMYESKVLSLGEITIDNEKHKVSVQGQPCELTYKEFELLKLLLQNVGIVLSRDVIMERVWGVDFEGESRTLDMHIKTLRQKLGESGKRIKTVRNVGYRLE